MFTRKSNEPNDLDRAIERLYLEMSLVDADSDEYDQLTSQLTKLYSLKDLSRASKISPDTKALVLGNLAGILMIVGHERMNVVTSKALNFVMKLR